ncbi:hypothetical protein JCM10020v2_004547 [Rhodotorula toruloides]
MPPSPPSLDSSLDSLAADMLAARHTALLTRRRQRSLEAEVEWDERDTAIRRGRVLRAGGGGEEVWASMGYGVGEHEAAEEEEGEEGWAGGTYPQPEEEWHGGFNEVPDVVIEGPGATVDYDWADPAEVRRRRRLGSDDWGEDEQRLYEEIGADAFFGYGTSGSEDEDEEFSETEDDNGDGAGTGDGVVSMDYDALAAAAAAPLEFATRLDEEEAFLAGLRERRLAEMGQETPAARQELQALLSGRYVGEAPLNPSPAPHTSQRSHDAPATSISTDLNVAAAALLSQDPSSALSYTSFLRPGAFFVGEQSLGKKPQPFSSLREPALPWRNNSANTSSTAHPAFAPFPSLGAAGSGGISDSLAIPRPSPSGTIEGPRNAITNFLRQSASNSNSTSTPRHLFQPAHHQRDPDPDPVRGHTTNPAARGCEGYRESWRAVEREMLSRARGVLAETSASREEERKEGEGVKERWNVQVTIQSYEPMNKRITGYMRAFGIDGGAPVSATYSDVTTHFSGDILHPIIDGLFASPSLTGSGGRTGSVKVTRAFEAESWIQLGPFKGLSKADLLEKSRSRQWIEEQTKGWILFRWKEQGFVNVAPTDSALSISGFYHAALNRRTGEIEGLYCDPAATPNQHLLLRPTSNTNGAVSFGAFDCR